MKVEEWVEKIEKKEKLFYLLLFFLFFFLFLFVTFPGGEIIDEIIERFNSSSDLNITYSDLKFSLLSGIKVKNLHLTFPAGEFSLEKVSVKPSYTKLLGGKLDLHIRIEDPSAKVNAFVSSGETFHLDLNFSSLDLSRLPFLEEKLQGTKLEGILKGKIQISYPGKWEKSRGLLAVEGRGVTLSDGGYLKLIGLDTLKLDTLSVMGRIDNGKLRIENFNLGDRQRYVKVGGSVVLRTPLENSILDLTVKMKLDSELEQKIGLFLPAAGFYKSPGGLYMKHLGGRLAFFLR